VDVIVTVFPEEGNFPYIAKALLAVADHPGQVRYVTWPAAGFVVPEDVFDRFQKTLEASGADEKSQEPPAPKRRGRPRKQAAPKQSAESNDNSVSDDDTSEEG
jgi:hypothetical protein